MLERLASRYRVELVPLGELEQAASAHGTNLPEAVRPIRWEPAAEVEPVAAREQPRTPDVIPDAIERSATTGLRFPDRLLSDPRAPHKRLSPRGRTVLWVLECCVAIAFVALAVTTYSTENKTSYVQGHGKRVSGRVQSIDESQECNGSQQGPCYPLTRLAVRLATAIAGVQVVHLSYAHAVSLHDGQRVQVLLDPTNPNYAELAGEPRSPGGLWIVAALLAVVSIVVTVRDGRSVLRMRQRRRHLPSSLTDRT
jgi:hypothetical protein